MLKCPIPHISKLLLIGTFLFLTSCNGFIGKISTGLITSNNLMVINFPDITVIEGSSANMIVIFPSAVPENFTMRWTISGPGAASALPFTTGSQVVSAGTLSTVLNVTTHSNGTYDGVRSFDLEIVSEEGTVIQDIQANFIINDNLTAPVISFDQPTQNVAENINSHTADLNMSVAATIPITVSYSFTNGTATASDYVTTSGSVTFNPGETTKTLPFQITDDLVVEATETFTISLTSATQGATIDASADQHIVSILDNDVAPTVQWTAASQTVGENAGAVTVTAQLSGVSGLAVSIPFTITGTATGSGTDYTITASPISIPAGSTTANVTVTIVDDVAIEALETVIVTMGSPTNATASGTTVHTLSIQDNDLGAFNISGIRNTAGTDTTDDANLNLGVNPRIVWGASSGADDYDVTVYEDDGTTVKCALQNTTSTSYDFSSCNLTVDTNYRAKVTAKKGSGSRDATNSLFAFYVNRQPTPQNDGPMYVMHTAGSTSYNVLADNPATGGADADSDPDGQTLTITAVSAGTKGVSGFTASTVTYDPTTGQNGVETLTYTVVDGKGGTATATLTIYVMTAATWTGAASNLWNNAGNWCGAIAVGNLACTNVGPVPDNTNVAIIDDTCQTNCSVQINVNSTVAGLKLDANSLTQPTGITFTVGGATVTEANKRYWVQNGGTFTGSDSALHADRLYLNGGTLTSTTGTFHIGYDRAATGEMTDGITMGASAVFNHNSGKVHYEALARGNCSAATAGTLNLAAHMAFWDFDLQAKQITPCGVGFDFAYLLTSGVGEFRVMNNLKIIDGNIGTGANVYLYGNLELECASTALSASCAHLAAGNIRFVGNGNTQTYKAHADARAPALFVNKPSGSVTSADGADMTARLLNISSGTFVAPAGTLTLGYNTSGIGVLITLTAPGAFDHNSGTARFTGSIPMGGAGSSRFTIDAGTGATVNFWNMIIDVHDSNGTNGWGQVNFGMDPAGTLNILNDLTVEDGGLYSANWNLYGDVTFKCDDPATPVLCMSGTQGGAIAYFKGSDPQTFTIESGARAFGYHSGLDKTNPGDTVTLVGDFLATNAADWNWFEVLRGTFNLNGYDFSYSGNIQTGNGTTGFTSCNGGSYTAGFSKTGSFPCP